MSISVKAGTKSAAAAGSAQADSNVVDVDEVTFRLFSEAQERLSNRLKVQGILCAIPLMLLAMWVVFALPKLPSGQVDPRRLEASTVPQTLKTFSDAWEKTFDPLPSAIALVAISATLAIAVSLSGGQREFTYAVDRDAVSARVRAQFLSNITAMYSSMCAWLLLIGGVIFLASGNAYRILCALLYFAMGALCVALSASTPDWQDRTAIIRQKKLRAACLQELHRLDAVRVLHGKAAYTRAWRRVHREMALVALSVSVLVSLITLSAILPLDGHRRPGADFVMEFLVVTLVLTCYGWIVLKGLTIAALHSPVPAMGDRFDRLNMITMCALGILLNILMGLAGAAETVPAVRGALICQGIGIVCVSILWLGMMGERKLESVRLLRCVLCARRLARVQQRIEHLETLREEAV